MVDPAEIRRVVDELARDEAAQAVRARACETFASALVETGRMLWLIGYVVGPDRASDASPLDFGDDETVGVATVAQIGGELGVGAIGLLKADNRYAAAALTRQLVEVEYLAAAFAEEHQIAADWLRADGNRRRDFWTPKHMRKRANGRFLSSDYWNHCDMGGHPSRAGMALLPDHQGFPPGLPWVDLAGHLFGIWESILSATERLLNGPIPPEWGLPDVPEVIARWQKEDGLAAFLRELSDLRRENPDAFSFDDPSLI